MKNNNYTLARENDGTIQITFTIDRNTISIQTEKTLEELGKSIEIPGFRKGNAPPEKVKDSLSRDVLIEKTLVGILPKMYTEALKNENIKPSMLPKFEVISAPDDNDWQVRAKTCEIPIFDLSDYKSGIKGIFSSSKIWTPKNNSDPKTNELSKEEKEHKIIDFLLSQINVIVPKILIEDDVNTRLSQLLSRIEKLGLTLEGYLNSINKHPDTLREEYSKQSEESIKIELILEKIAISENINVLDEEINNAVNTASPDPKIKERLDTPEQRSIIKTVLLRRKALDFLLSLG